MPEVGRGDDAEGEADAANAFRAEPQAMAAMPSIAHAGMIDTGRFIGSDVPRRGRSFETHTIRQVLAT
jgi:hypothetical protein